MHVGSRTQGVDPERPRRAGDQSEVLRVVEPFEHGDAVRPGDDLGDARQRQPLSRGDDSAVEPEPDRAGDEVVIGDQDVDAGVAEEGGDPLLVARRDEDRAHPMP